MSSVNGKIVIGSILFFIVTAIIFPDLLFGFILEIAHTLLELLHVLFELIEEFFDLAIEHLLGTGLHDTQVIVFYILLSIFAFGVYRLCLKVPSKYRKLKNSLFTAYDDCKMESQTYWQNLGTFKKIQWLVIGMSAFFIWIFFGI